MHFGKKSLSLYLLPRKTGKNPRRISPAALSIPGQTEFCHPAGPCRPDRAALGPGSAPVTRPGVARPCAPGARGSPSSFGSAGSSAEGRVGNFSSKINWCRNASYFPRNNATQLAGDVFICSRKRPFTARRVSLCPCARRAKEENKTKTTNSSQTNKEKTKQNKIENPQQIRDKNKAEKGY